MSATSTPPAEPVAPPPVTTVDSVRAVKMPLVDRLASGLVTAAPPIMLGVGAYFGWTGNALNWRDLLILALSYMIIGSGITVGSSAPRA